MTILSSTQRIIQISLAGGLVLGLATLAGCGIGSSAPGTPSGPVPLALSGRVHGGQQPVTGSTIQLWTVGSTGYGSQGTNILGSHVVTTDSTGSFDITGDYTCPTNDTLVYLLASGGNPGLAAGTNNTAIELAAPLGACGALSTNKPFIFVDEVTTAATAVALGQYFTTTFGSSSQDSIGTNNSTQAQVGLANAFATVNTLVDTTQGTAKTSVLITGAAGNITATPEAAKLNTIADILAACVNSDGGPSSPCQTTLFPSVAPTGKAQPTDTLQAAVYMSLNPTSNNTNGSAANLTALYGLQTAQSPFVGLATQPTDWTIGILYSATTAALMPKPQNIAVDSNGNVWVLSNNSGAADLTELSPTGTPLTDPQTLTAPTTTPAQPQPTIVFAGTASNPRNLAIDTNNNVWLTTSSSATDANGDKSNGTVYEYMSNGASAAYSTAKSAYGLAINGNNDVFVSQQSTSAVYELYEFPGGDTTKPITYPIATATAGTAGTTGINNYIAPEYMAFDPTGNLWMTGGVAASNFAVELTNLSPSATIVAACATYPCLQTTSTTANTYNTVALNSATQAWGVAADTNSVFIDAVTANGVSNVPYASPSTNTLIGTTATFTTPHYNAVDGAGNVWVANQNGTPGGSGATPGGSVSEISSAGVILSPSTSSTTTMNPGYVHSGLSTAGGIAIDPSGNVWVANNSTTTNAKSVFEIVGAAAPTATPLALALKNSLVGQKP